MNLYLVLSENLTYIEPVLDFGQGPEFDYRIYEMVFAKSRGQAKYLAWKKDRESYTGDMRDMPKFQVKTIAYNLDINEPRVINGNPCVASKVYDTLSIKE